MQEELSGKSLRRLECGSILKPGKIYSDLTFPKVEAKKLVFMYVYLRKYQFQHFKEHATANI